MPPHGVGIGGAPGFLSHKGLQLRGLRREASLPALGLGRRGKQGHGGREEPEMGTPYGCPGGTFGLSLPPEKKREKQTNKFGFFFFPINLEIQRDLKRRVGGRQFKGGKGVPDRRGDGRGSLLCVSSHARVSQSSPPGAGSGSWGRRARGNGPPASGTGAAGVGAEPRAARGQVANWIRERGGESHGRVREQGGGARAAGAAERGSCPHRRPPSLPPMPGENRLSGRSCRLPPAKRSAP